MAECPQFQLQPQVIPIYQPSPSSNTFPMQSQPMYPISPAHFGYPPNAWSPIHPYPPQQKFHQVDEDENSEFCNTSQPNYENNDAQNEIQNQHVPLQIFQSHGMPNKFDTRHEEFRKYLEENGILSSFTNILAEMYKDPLRPTDPLGYIRDKLNCTRPESVELSNLRIWCEEYQTKTIRLEKELQHVIERLRKYEPYNPDAKHFNESSSEENKCKSCVWDVVKQRYKFVNKEQNVKKKLFKKK